MKRMLVAVVLSTLLGGCNGRDPNAPALSREPISVRGWISDVATGDSGRFKTVETESARKAQLFQAANLWVDGAPYVSGGIAETGAFIVLDVPPGNPVVTFTAPGAPASKLVLQNVPGNADVIVPGLILTSTGVDILNPADLKVRIAAKIKAPHATGRNAIIAGHSVPIIETPLEQMRDRLNYPDAPTASAPLATVK
jgi:hypothetical protein